MNYQETVNWMFQQLPMYQNQGKSAYKVDLSNTLLLAKHLNHPEQYFRSIHIAGTNGKGSTSHMLASVLQEAGYKVGLYTSPHLKDFRERIKINGKDVSQEFVVKFINQNLSFFKENQLSFFEMTVGMAFDYFKKQNVDIAIIEVGLGGRLDSTNIITPEISVITNIGFDHLQFLGNTYEDIAAEKAGIIKPKVPAVIGETQQETKDVFLKKAEINISEIYFADQLIKQKFESDLKGSYQKHNIKTVVQTISVLNNQKRFFVSSEHLNYGLKNVVNNTGLKGRWQILQEQPKVICDTAHNKEGLSYVMKQLENEDFNILHIIFGVVNDKDLDSILPLLPKHARYYLCKPNIPRGMEVNQLRDKFLANGFVGDSYNAVNEALNSALQKAKPNDLVYVGGSTFIVAEII